MRDFVLWGFVAWVDVTEAPRLALNTGAPEQPRSPEGRAYRNWCRVRCQMHDRGRPHRSGVSLARRIEFEHFVRNLTVDDWFVGRCSLSAEITKILLRIDPSHQKRLFFHPNRHGATSILALDTQALNPVELSIFDPLPFGDVSQPPSTDLVRNQQNWNSACRTTRDPRRARQSPAERFRLRDPRGDIPPRLDIVSLTGTPSSFIQRALA